MATTIEIDEQVTVGELADLLSIPASKLIAELFKNGVAATVNEKIDFDTAQIIVGELPDIEVELAKREHEAAPARTKREVSDKAESRPPVVAMMGHVDHGKTSLLDAIRGGETAKGEAGGITQHLSAYQIDHNGRLITFLDTPGHEAFAALREHGARLTDLVVLVVAADDGIKPQTLEAIRFARQAGVRIIVAASKMDKATDTQLNQLKAQLAENELLPEDFGGETVVVPVSAKEKTGINELLDIVLLVSDLEEHKADKIAPACGLVIEAHQEKGRGPVAVALVEQGTLHAGEFVAIGGTYGKVRNLETTTGKPIKEAGPSTPVIITGLKNLPEFGDEFEVVKNEKVARGQAAQKASERRSGGSSAATSSSELLRIISRSNKLTELNIIVKADVQGSLTSVVDSLKTLNTEEVAVRFVSTGVGVINENDVHTAATTGAILYGFSVTLPSSIKQLAARDRVPIRIYNVIYELIDDVKKGIFKITKTEVICGGQVTKGTLRVPSLCKLVRDKKVIADNLEVTKLQRGPTEVTEVPEGEMCGLSFKSEARVEVQEDDRIELFSRETKVRTL
jgi:translation initiation factor IF-2